MEEISSQIIIENVIQNANMSIIRTNILQTYKFKIP